MQKWHAKVLLLPPIVLCALSGLYANEAPKPPQPQSLEDILACPPEKVDPARLALIVARMEDEKVDIEANLRKLDAWAGYMRKELAKERNLKGRINLLSHKGYLPVQFTKDEVLREMLLPNDLKEVEEAAMEE